MNSEIFTNLLFLLGGICLAVYLGYGWYVVGVSVIIGVIIFLISSVKSGKNDTKAVSYRSAEQLQADYDQAKAIRKENEEQKLGIIREHADTLGRQYAQKVRRDRYGVLDRAEWEKEVDYFIDRVLGLKSGQADPSFVATAKRLIDEAASAKASTLAETQIADGMSPLEFEAWCSRVLEKAGWSVTTTKASGDQGADVVANRDGYRVVLQCKLYSSPVGNGAVQEAFSAQRHYGARASAVVTNAGFTRAAQELAGTTGVLLLHHAQLADIDDLLVEKGLSVRRVASATPSPTPPLGLSPTVPHAGLDDLGARIEAARARRT